MNKSQLAIVVSGSLNIILLIQINKEKQYRKNLINALDRANLITLYYILQRKNKKDNFKEEMKMRIMSNRTKVIIGAAVVLGGLAVISAIKDHASVSEITEAIEDAANELAEGTSEAVSDAVEEVADTASEIIEA